MSELVSFQMSLLRDIFERAERDPQATFEFVPQREGILCGVMQGIQVLQSLGKHPFQFWALDEGAALIPGEVAVRVRGYFLRVAPQITSFTGQIALASGWGTAARDLVLAAAPLPVILTSAYSLYPTSGIEFECATVIGGCLPLNDPRQRGLIPRALILLMGDTVKAAHAFDELLPRELPRLIRADTFYDDADEAVRVALAMGDKLFGIVLDEEEERNPISSDLLKRVRAQLDLAGFPRVKMFVSGNLTIERVTEWKEAQAPLDGFFAGETLARAAPIPFSVELKEGDSKPLARRGLTPGTTPNLRLKKIEVE